MKGFSAWLTTQLRKHERIAVLGDFNIAPEDRDVHDPGIWQGQVPCSPPERAAFQELIGLGFKDSFRLFDRPERRFSWWDYRMNAFQRKMGLRIDHILLSEQLARECKSSRIDVEMRRNERPSDHAPVIASFRLPVTYPGRSALPVPVPGSSASVYYGPCQARPRPLCGGRRYARARA